jgi:Arc/MetJ-type ribon-helix-helix transcriptional regulator
MSITVDLSPETQAYIEEGVRNGTFATASEFIEAALQRQMLEEAWFAGKLKDEPEESGTRLKQQQLPPLDGKRV